MIYGQQAEDDNVQIHALMYMRYTGWTLIEVVIVLLMVGVMSGFVISGMRAWYEHTSTRRIVESIVNAVEWSEVYALTAKEKIWLTHLPGCVDWSDGMLLETLQHEKIHEWHWLAAGVSVNWHGFLSPEGLIFARDLQHAAMNGFFLLHKHGKILRKIRVNRIGRVKTGELIK